MSVDSIYQSILAHSRACDFSGYDPFDGLNSRLFELMPVQRSRHFGLAITQLCKRSPVNLRPVLAVPKKRNPKGIALFILGLIEDYKRTNDSAYLREAIELADWLLNQQCDKEQWAHGCWGYHFDWKARAFYVPRGKPNIITTVYVAQALYALGQLVNQNRFIESALDSSHFIVKSLYTEHDGNEFFAYIPGETAFVHNASLWGAAWVAKAAIELGNKEYQSLALKVARQSVREQKLDGSWVYGTRHHHQFIDGFHTGYNLEALNIVRTELSVTEFDDAIAKGMEFYKEHLFEPDGTAKYYHNNRYPLDMHSVSQAIFTLLKVGATEEDEQLAKKVVERAIATLYMPNKKRFVYQKNRYFTNKINYIRWTQAWVYYSFAYFNHYFQEDSGS